MFWAFAIYQFSHVVGLYVKIPCAIMIDKTSSPGDPHTVHQFVRM